MSDADWNVAHFKRAPKGASGKTEQIVNAARRQGVAVETATKYGAAQNKHAVTTLNTAKLDQETEELKHDKFPLDVGKLIQQGRQAKGWTQKDLATRINEKPQVVNEYECGKGVPNQVVLGKIERAIGLKLRGKDKGQALVPPGKDSDVTLSSGNETVFNDSKGFFYS
nr:EOG090X0ILG [Triops cancriformis]